MYTKLTDVEWLRTEYVDKLRTLKSLAKEVGCHQATIGRTLKRYGISRRKRTSKHPLLNNKEWLRKAYLDDMRTQTSIAREVGCTEGVIRDALRAMGIVTRGNLMAYRLKRPDGGRLGDKAGHWKGGRVVLGAGYIALYKPDHPYADKRGYVMEHRLVMEEHIGRLLTPREIVHHIDGDKKNNAIENLELTKIGRHIHDHFQNSHETIELRKQVAELEAQLLKYKERYGDIV